MPYKCLHCSVVVSPESKYLALCNSRETEEEIKQRGYSFSDEDDLIILHTWSITYSVCTSCNKPIVYMRDETSGYVNNTTLEFDDEMINTFIIFPKAINRELPIEVPENYRNYFKEACLVLSDSPAASAALSRRILQLLLVEKAGVTNKGNLAKMIDEVVNSEKLPSYLADDIDKVKEIGNYAAHPNKSDHLSEIIDVEPGEAEWSLDILEGLFDFYFVQPIKAQKRRDEWNNKTKKKS